MTEYICEFCNNTFLNQKVLEKHKKSAKYCLDIQHNNYDKKISCKYCEKKFSRKNL
jgi:uncharacterized Zn-finger protein